MSAAEMRQKDLEDLKVKLEDARRAAEASGASEREKSDLKLIEQEYLAAEQKVRLGAGVSKPVPTGNSKAEMDKKLDAALKDSFPGSDPVSFVEAAPVKEKDGDRKKKQS